MSLKRPEAYKALTWHTAVIDREHAGDVSAAPIQVWGVAMQHLLVAAASATHEACEAVIPRDLRFSYSAGNSPSTPKHPQQGQEQGTHRSPKSMLDMRDMRLTI